MSAETSANRSRPPALSRSTLPARLTSASFTYGSSWPAHTGELRTHLPAATVLEATYRGALTASNGSFAKALTHVGTYMPLVRSITHANELASHATGIASTATK